MSQQNNVQDKKRLSAVCGLFCPSCSVFIGTTEEPQRLKAIADRHQMSVEAWTCEGCRAETRSDWCEHHCEMVPCATEHGLEFCGECEEYPCDVLREFQAGRPHRIELWDAQERIAPVGYSQWFDDMRAHYSCPHCQTINSAYDIACRTCGGEPSCRYVQLHQKAIEAYLSEST